MEENNFILFYKWLCDEVDYNMLSQEDKIIIKDCQDFFDMQITDDTINYLLDRLNCSNLDELINSDKKLDLAIQMINVDRDLLMAKLLYMKKVLAVDNKNKCEKK